MWKFLQQHMTWRAVPVAAIAAGSVFLLVNMLAMSPILQVSPGLLLRYMASLVMGSEVLTDATALTPVIGIIVHYALSLLFTVIITVVIHRWGMPVGIVGGGLLGLAIYGINLYTLTVFFEWFFAINNEVLLISHVLFGMTAGGVYERFDHYDAGLNPQQSNLRAGSERSTL
jgi:hypothetical protein